MATRNQWPNQLVAPFQGLSVFRAGYPGLRSQTRFSLGYHMAGFQP